MKIAIFLFYSLATIWAGYMTLHDSGTPTSRESYNSVRSGSVGYSHSSRGYSYGK